MTPRKPLPYAYGDDLKTAIAEAYLGIDILEPLLEEKPITREEHYRRIGRAMQEFSVIIRILESVKVEGKKP